MPATLESVVSRSAITLLVTARGNVSLNLMQQYAPIYQAAAGTLAEKLVITLATLVVGTVAMPLGLASDLGLPPLARTQPTQSAEWDSSNAATN